MHVYKRTLLAKKVDDVVICCDDKKIFNTVKKFGVKVLMTSKHHQNGTERICEAYKKLGKKYDLVVDIQGDEPLISPYHINDVVNHHLKNFDSDIILPILKAKAKNNTNIIKGVPDKKNKVFGLVYDYQGTTATALQFYLTDSANHFFRGALYFDTEVNDSILPVSNFLQEDIKFLIESFQWKDITDEK